MGDRIGDERPLARQGIGCGDAEVEAGPFEQATQRDDESLRKQQHVEEQGAHRGDAEHAKRRACRLAHQAPPGESHGIHRRASLRLLRRSSAHAATTVAETPSGTAMATQTAATSGVTRTNTSAVSYRHWKKRLMIPSEPSESTSPNSEPALAISTPSMNNCTRMRCAGRPISRSTPTVGRRSSTSMMVSASRNTVDATIVTIAIARRKRSSTTNGPGEPAAAVAGWAGTPRIRA